MIARDLLAGAVMLAAALLAGIACSGSLPRRLLGLALALTTLLPPWLANPPSVRGALCLAGAVVVLRVIDLLRDPEQRAWAWRLGHVVSPVDSRLLTRAPPAFGLALAAAIGWLLPAAAGLWLAFVVGPPADARGWVLRWVGGLFTVYACVEALWAAVRGVYELLGFTAPPLHRLPLMSLSIRELWGERWSRPISRWLADTLYVPAARRGLPRLGLAAAFFASAALHAYVVLVCAGAAMALMMLCYFVLQGLLVRLEAAIGVRRWPAIAAHVWVLSVMIATSPLFTEPFLRAVGIASGPGLF